MCKVCFKQTKLQSCHTQVACSLSQSQSHVTTGGHSVSMSWCRIHSEICDRLKIAVLSLWGPLSDERSGMSPASHYQQYLVLCQKFNVIYILHVTWFMSTSLFYKIIEVGRLCVRVWLLILLGNGSVNTFPPQRIEIKQENVYVRVVAYQMLRLCWRVKE
jgi:hypothetical protein